MQNDREEEIKQYELEIEAYKADLKKAVDTVKESECSLVMEREGRASDVARSEEIVAGLNTELEGLRRNIEELMAKKTAMCELNKRFEEDVGRLNGKVAELEAQLEEETKRNMRKLDSYYAEYEAKEVQLAGLVRRIDEMKESHVLEVRGLAARSEDLKKKSEAEYEAAKLEWERVIKQSGENMEKRLAGRLILPEFKIRSIRILEIISSRLV